MKKCKGCSVVPEESCFFVAVNETELCPCIGCLVMVMCNPKGRCSERNDMVNHVSIVIVGSYNHETK